MTKEQLIQYLRVCADLADAPKDGVAHVAIVPLRQAIQLLESSAEPKAPHTISGQEIVEGSKRAAEAAETATVEQMKHIAGKVRVLSAFHCDFGCDVPSHKPGCPFYVNRQAEPRAPRPCPCMSHEVCIKAKLDDTWYCRRD